MVVSQDVRVPICPLCDQPVPVKKGEDPNIRVNEHIASDCMEQKKKKVHFAEFILKCVLIFIIVFTTNAALHK